MSLTFSASNEQIFRSIVAGEHNALGIILANFNPLIRSRAGHYLTVYEDYGLEYVDLEVVGKSALLTAIKLYRGDNIPFAAFASVVIQNAYRNFVKQVTRPTSLLGKWSISLDGYYNENNTTLLISDSVSDSEMMELGLYRPSAIGYFEDVIPFPCESIELEIIESKLNGYNYQEIREKLDLPKRKLDEIIAILKEKWNEKK